MPTSQVSSRKKPERTCLGCRKKTEKSQLIRIVRTPEGSILVDRTGKLNGRGAYVCSNETCVRKAVKSGALSRALKCVVSQETAELLSQEVLA